MAIIGAGITGAAIALHAAIAGYKVLLFDKGDFASGTSSKSTKLVHGGLRYLEMLQFGLVHEALTDRKILTQTAEHLVYPEPIVFPLYKNSPPGFWKLKAGLTLYDLLTFGRNLKPHEMLNTAQTLALAPQILKKNLIGSGLFYDCATNDSRLTLATIRTAHEKGADVINYLELKKFKRENDLFQLQLKDNSTGSTTSVECRLLVSAVGAWTGEMINKNSTTQEHKIKPSKGIHLVFDRKKLPLTHTVAITAPSDKRLMFVRPWDENFVFAGTTDDEYSGSLDDIAVTAKDIDYVLQALRHNFPAQNLQTTDIISSWAGIRPLIETATHQAKSSYKLSREHSIWQEEPGFFIISGGKLTTHRTMAFDLLSFIRKNTSSFKHVSDEETQPTLIGSCSLQEFKQNFSEKKDPPIANELHLYHNYGSETDYILQKKSSRTTIFEHFPHIYEELDFSLQHEMVINPEDWLMRRTNLFYQMRNLNFAQIEGLLQRMAEFLNWTKTEVNLQKQRLSNLYADQINQAQYKNVENI